MTVNEMEIEISKLNLDDTLRLVETIWDSIALSNDDFSLPDWQKKELDHRYEEYKSGKLELYDWEEVHQSIKEKYS